MGNKPKVLMIVTLDTKEIEARFIRKCLEDCGLEVYHLDASIRYTDREEQSLPAGRRHNSRPDCSGCRQDDARDPRPES